MRHPDRPLRALGWMLLAALGFSTMAVYVKHFAGRIPQFQLVFARSAVNLAVVAALMAWRGEGFLPERKPLLLFRGLAGFTSLSLGFYAIQRLPLALATLLNWTAPLWVIVFSALLLGERTPRRALGWIALAFLGLLMVASPGATSPGEGLAARLLNAGVPLLALLAGLCAAAAGGLAYIAVRAATARVGVNVIVFYFTLVSAVLSAAPAWRDWVAPGSPRAWAELVLIGLAGTLGQMAMTQAYRYAAAGVVSAMGLSNAALGAFWGWVVFGETLRPEQWLGILAIGGGVAMLALSQGGPRPRTEPVEPVGSAG